jgi:hypothetical protein
MKKALFIFFIIFSLTLNATNYYVAPAASGGSDSNNGSIGSPWLTVQYAWASLSAGDYLYMRGGTYLYTARQQLNSKSGTITDSIHVWNYPGEVPIINFWPAANTIYSGFSLSNDNYISFRGITITGIEQPNPNGGNGVYGIILWTNVDNTLFDRMTTSYIGGWGMVIGSYCNSITVLNCDSHHNQDPYSQTAYGGADGWEATSYGAGTSTNIKFIGCRAWWNSDDGWDLRQNDADITFENCWSFRNGYIPGTWSSVGNGVGFKLGGCWQEVTPPGLYYPGGTNSIIRTITNSLAFDNSATGFTPEPDSYNAVLGTEMFNNTAYRNQAGFVSGGYGNYTLMQNNIAYSNSENGRVETGSTSNHNTWDAGAPGLSSADFLSLDTTGVSGPRGANGELPVLNFLKLASSSDLIDAGTDVGLTYSGTYPDLGMYEYSSGGAAVIPTVTTTAITAILTTTATSGGNVTSDGGASVTQKGVCWSTSANPTVDVSHTTEGAGTGTYVSAIYGLSSTTLYHVRAYATNSVGTAYGSDISFTTAGTTILTINGQTYTSTEAGEWSGVVITRTNPTTLTFTNNSITSINASGYMLQAGDEGVGATNNNLNGAVITGNKLVWNGTDAASITHGIFIGYNINCVVKYNYLDKVPYGILPKSGLHPGANMAYTTTGGIAYNIVKSAKVSANSKSMNNVCYYNNTFYNGHGQKSLIHLYPNDGADPHSEAPTNIKIRNNIFYSVQSIPMIKVDSVGSIATLVSDYNLFYSPSGNPIFSVAGVTKTWEEWQALGFDTHSTVANPNFVDTIAFVPTARLDYGTDLGAMWETGLSTSAVWTVGVAPTTMNQNGSWQVGARVFAPAGVILPSVVTSPVTVITSTFATGNGNVTSDGGDLVTDRGVCWSTSANPTTAGSHTSSGTGTGTFAASITGLTKKTTYYVRAYATNSAGTSYGNEITFITPSFLIMIY